MPLDMTAEHIKQLFSQKVGMTVATQLQVKNLWKVYKPKGIEIDVDDPDSLAAAQEAGAVPAVQNVSFSVEKGEIFVIMGLSGSGKSTLIRCLLRLIEPSSGEVWIDNDNITALDQNALIQARRSKAAMVFQHYGLLPHKTVLQNAAFGLKLKGVPKRERLDRARECLDQVGLAGWEDRFPSALSGGMQQRVGIARALAMDPSVLLMDEPFSGLDPLIRVDMQEELVTLQEKLNVTILFVTHDVEEAMRLGDRMAIMRDGKFIQVGEPDEVAENPVDDYVARFVKPQRRRRAMQAKGPLVEEPARSVI